MSFQPFTKRRSTILLNALALLTAGFAIAGLTWRNFDAFFPTPRVNARSLPSSHPLQSSQPISSSIVLPTVTVKPKILQEIAQKKPNASGPTGAKSAPFATATVPASQVH